MSSDRRLRLSPGAEADFRSIMRYTRDVWGEEQEIAYSNEILDILASIKAFPSLGAPRLDIAEGVRGRVSGKHLVLYRLEGNEIEVIRIVHVRMNPELEGL